MADSKKKKADGRSKSDRPKIDESGKKLTAEELENVAGGQSASGQLDAGIHFKYDLKAQKES